MVEKEWKMENCVWIQEIRGRRVENEGVIIQTWSGKLWIENGKSRFEDLNVQHRNLIHISLVAYHVILRTM